MFWNRLLFFLQWSDFAAVYLKGRIYKSNNFLVPRRFFFSFFVAIKLCLKVLGILIEEKGDTNINSEMVSEINKTFI